jgi:hypothetical protein
MPRRNEKSDERSPFGPKSEKAPMWLISEAIGFLRVQHPAVLRMIHSRWEKEGQPRDQNIERFLVANHMALGRRIRNLLLGMKYEWDAVQLDDSYIEIVTRAMQEVGLKCL